MWAFSYLGAFSYSGGAFSYFWAVSVIWGVFSYLEHNQLYGALLVIWRGALSYLWGAFSYLGAFLVF